MKTATLPKRKTKVSTPILSIKPEPKRIDIPHFYWEKTVAEAFDHSFGLICSDSTGRIQKANDLAAEILGYRSEELIGANQQVLWYQAIPNHASNDKCAGKIQLKSRRGEPIWVEGSQASVQDGTVLIFRETAYEAPKPVLPAPVVEPVSSWDRDSLQGTNNAYALVEFDPQGRITNGNALFQRVYGYSVDEVVGKHHQLFVSQAYATSPSYRTFWQDLAAGKEQTGIFQRYNNKGQETWVQGTYSPIVDDRGTVTKVILIARISRGILEAINSSYSLIEFDINGHVLAANGIFTQKMGYRIEEIIAKHHSLFVSPTEANSSEYAQFWRSLSNGEIQTGAFHQYKKTGEDIWFQGSYAPIRSGGVVIKVVKIASDITEQKKVDAALKDVMDKVKYHATTLASAALRLSSTSRKLVVNAEETSSQSQEVSTSAQKVSDNIVEVVASSEQMSSSINEIAKNSAEAANVAARAVKAAEATNATISKLGESSAQIGKVIKVITSIAQQTNLLALNATIEAARAGESGKGFAVVAKEVKELAKETARATEDISQKIEAIQNDTKRAIEAISDIGGIICSINQYQSTIAAAVEEQTATSTQIAQILSQASKGSTEIAHNISKVAETALSTSSEAEEGQRASRELEEMAESLQDIVQTSAK